MQVFTLLENSAEKTEDEINIEASFMGFVNN